MKHAALLTLMLAACSSEVHLSSLGGAALGARAALGGGGGSATTCPVGFYASGTACVAEPVFWSRDFRLNQSTLSTPTLPPNTTAAHSVAQCVVSSGTTWTCAKAAGGTDTVTQGTSPLAITDPLGFIDRDDATNTNSPALSTASDFGSSFSAAQTMLFIGYGTMHISGAGSVQTAYKLAPGVGDAVQGRGNGTLASPGWNCLAAAATASSSGGPLDGYGLNACTWTGAVDQHLKAYASGYTASVALASLSYTSGGTFNFLGDGAGGNALQGLGGVVQLFNSDVSSTTTLAQYTQGYFGLVADTSTTSTSNSPIDFVRGGPGWVVDGNGRAWKYAGGDATIIDGGAPIVDANGIHLRPGPASSRPQANGMVAGASNGNNLGSLTAIGTPTLSTATAAGPFYDYCPTAACTKEGALVVDDDGAAFEGYKGSIAPGDNETTVGEYTIAGYFSQGTSGTARDKVTIGFVTDGTATAACPTSVPAGLTCAVSGGTCKFSGHTATIQRDICHVDIEGSPTSIRGEMLVGGVAADTGSITIYQYQAGWGIGVPAPIGDNGVAGQDILSIPATETATWPQGDQRGVEIEIVFSLDYDMPSEVNNVNIGGEYLFNTSDGAGAETMLLMFQDGATNGHAASDVFVRSGLRSTAYNSTCAGGSFGDGGTDITSPGTLGSFSAFTQLVERWVVKPAGTVASVPRVNQWIYFDTCANASTCHATTLRASNTSGTMCASDFSETYGLLGGRASGSSPTATTNPMQGTIAKFSVRQAI